MRALRTTGRRRRARKARIDVTAQQFPHLHGLEGGLMETVLQLQRDVRTLFVQALELQLELHIAKRKRRQHR